MKVNTKFMLFSLLIVAGAVLLIASGPYMTGMAAKGAVVDEADKYINLAQLVGVVVVIVGAVGFYISLKKSAESM